MIPDLYQKVKDAIKSHPDYTLKQIGGIFGLTRQRIHQVVKEIGKKHYTPKPKGCQKAVFSEVELREAIKNKTNQRVFMRQHHASEKSLKEYLNLYGLVWPSNTHNEKIKLDDLKEVIKNNPEFCLRELAGHFGVTETAISQRIRYHDLPYRKKK